jgi:hypothetical protein
VRGSLARIVHFWTNSIDETPTPGRLTPGRFEGWLRI